MTRRLIAVLAALMLLLGTALAGGVAAAGPGSFAYFAGSGPVCALAPDACPDFARAPNGDRIELTGAGDFTVQPKSATGGGTFVHRDPNGNVLASGTWTATELISFHSYGSGAAQGLPPELWGGQIILRVHLVVGAFATDGLLTIDCELGKVPAGAAEGSTLVVPGIVHFNKPVSGFTVFVRGT